MPWPLAVVASYLIGAVPTSYLAGRLARGIDLRQHGSRNLGATNVYRVLGWGWAIPVGVIDVLKGVVPVALIAPAAIGPAWVAVMCGIAAVVGHVFSPYVAFKGGKGVATAAGMFLALAPLAVVCALPLWGLVVWLSGYVSLGSVVTAAVFPVLVRLTRPDAPPTFFAALALAALIVVSHRANLRRLVDGTENRFGRRARAGGGTG
jgi:glycerol-3-phosphate acyltransferase PlsY